MFVYKLFLFFFFHVCVCVHTCVCVCTGKSDMDVVVSSKPLDVVYNVPLVERIQKFFDASDDVVANDALTASYAVQMDVSGCVCVCWVAHSLYE